MLDLQSSEMLFAPPLLRFRVPDPSALDAALLEEGSSGMIEFLDPRSDLPNGRLFKAKAFRPKRKIRPEAGEIVLFPSCLVHGVYPNETRDDRVTIAFNATFEKAGTAGDDGDDD